MNHVSCANISQLAHTNSGRSLMVKTAPANNINYNKPPHDLCPLLPYPLQCNADTLIVSF